MKAIIASGIIILLLMPVSTSLIVSIPARSDTLPLGDISEWTVMFYFAGDQLATTYSLSDKMLTDLSNLKSVGSTSDVNLVVLMDLDGANDSCLYYVHKDGVTEIPLTEVNASWTDEVDMGDENTLADFMSWTVENYPANHYNVYLNNHGGGWMGICVDENPEYNLLKLSELKNVFLEIKEQIGRKIDVVSMDACLMAAVEVAYELKEGVEYLVASESFIRTHSENGGLFLNWMVNEIYGSLVDNPYMTGEELCIESVDDFRTDKAFILPFKIVKPQAVDCISAINISEIENVASAVEDMAQKLLSRSLFLRLFLSRVFLKTQSFSGGFDFLGLTYLPFIDLYDFSKNVKRFIPGRPLKNSAEEVMNSVLDAVIVERHGNRRIRWEHTDAHGLSIYLPYRRYSYLDGYESSDFALDTNWDEFIKSCWFLHR